MKIQKVIQQVMVRCSYARRNCRSHQQKQEIKISVYMTSDYYHECMREINDGVSPTQYEFFKDRTIDGCPVHIVVDSPGHPDFLVLEV